MWHQAESQHLEGLRLRFGEQALGSDEKAGGGGDEGGALGADWSAEVPGPGRGSCPGRSWGRGSVCPSPLMIPHSGLWELCAPFQSQMIGKADALSHSNSLEHSTPQPTSKPAESQHFLQPVGG